MSFVFSAMVFVTACGDPRPSLFGDTKRGRDAIEAIGCGTCHTIDGIPGATGRFGPALNGIRRRSILAGELVNTPDNMVRWVKNPQAIEPGVAMPPLGAVSERTARDIVAYLYTLK